MVDSVSFFKDAKVATEANPEVEWKKRVLYLGPQVGRVSENFFYDD